MTTKSTAMILIAVGVVIVAIATPLALETGSAIYGICAAVGLGCTLVNLTHL